MSEKGSVLERRARKIVYIMDRYFAEERNLGKDYLEKLRQAVRATSDRDMIISGEFHSQLLEHFKSYMNVTKRISMASGVTKNTIIRIRHESAKARAARMSDSTGSADLDIEIPVPKKKPRGRSVVLNESELCALSSIINSFYIDTREVPSINKIFAKAQSDLNFKGSKSTLRRIMVKDLGCKFKSDNDKSQLVHKPNINAWRLK